MRTFFRKWQVWAVLFGIAVACIVALSVQTSTESVARRDYMTLAEYNRIDIGMSLDKLKEVQDAKPAKEVEPIAEGQFAIQYNGEREGSFVIIFLKKQDDGDLIVSDKSQTLLTE